MWFQNRRAKFRKMERMKQQQTPQTSNSGTTTATSTASTNNNNTISKPSNHELQNVQTSNKHLQDIKPKINENGKLNSPPNGLNYYEYLHTLIVLDSSASNETCLQDIQEILKRSLQNFSKILSNMFLLNYLYSNVLGRFKSTHNDVFFKIYISFFSFLL